MGERKIADSHRSDLHFSPAKSVGSDLLNKTVVQSCPKQTLRGTGLSAESEPVPRPDIKEEKKRKKKRKSVGGLTYSQ